MVCSKEGGSREEKQELTITHADLPSINIKKRAHFQVLIGQTEVIWWTYHIHVKLFLKGVERVLSQGTPKATGRTLVPQNTYFLSFLFLTPILLLLFLFLFLFTIKSVGYTKGALLNHLTLLSTLIWGKELTGWNMQCPLSK